MKGKVGSWIFEPEFECMPREKLEKLKEERLIKMVNYAYDKLDFYKKRFKEAGIKPSDIKGLEDLTKIPFTYKDDLRKNYPYGLMATSMDEIIEIHCSSGTTGTPTTALYTARDVEVWARAVARCCASIGLRKGDILQVAYGYGLFTGGLGLHYGGQKVGAAVLPISSGETERQIRLARELKTTAIACTPTYAAYMGEYAIEKMGIDPAKELYWKSGTLGAEPWSEELRERIENLLGIEAFDIYGLSEIIGPGVAHECQYHNGSHLYEDLFLPEIIDPETGEHVEEGELGELVLTTLDREGMPLLRFRTGDLTRFTTEECECGRTIGRMEKVLGRSDDMVKVRGVKFWPKTVEDALLSVKGVSTNYTIVIERPKLLDVMTINVEPTKELYEEVGGDMSKLEDLKKEIAEKVKSIVGVSAIINLVPVGTLPRFIGKAKRVEDRRKIT